MITKLISTFNMSIELSKKDKRIARELIEKGLQKEFQQGLQQFDAILQKWKNDQQDKDLTRWEQSKILIHEATFLRDDEDKIHTHGNKHSYLEEVMEMVSGANVEQLILGHFSSRYSPELIDRRILELCNQYAINKPVFRVLPGTVATDILKTRPINS